MAKISIDILTPLKNWFIEKGNLITSWSSTASDTKIVSEKLVKTELDKKAVKTDVDTALAKKIDKTSIKTSVTNSLTNDDVVGGKTLYDKITEMEASIPDGMTHTNITDWDTATSGFQTVKNLETSISTSTSKYPSSSAVNSALSGKIDNSSKTTSVTNTSSDNQVPSAKAVYDLYNNIPKWAVKMVASVDDLPATGVVGTIYLISDSGSGKNQYKEFFWNDSADEPGYEQFGGVELDVSKFITKKQMTDYLANNSTITLSSTGELALNITDATE